VDEEHRAGHGAEGRGARRDGREQGWPQAVTITDVDASGSALGAASVIFDARGQVLLVHHTYGRLNWEIPGGICEPGESAFDAAIREAREEIGVSLVVVRLVGTYWERNWRADRDMHHFVFEARLDPSSEPQVNDRSEISELGWFSPRRLPGPISDFTVKRIGDALAKPPPALWTISPRRWLAAGDVAEQVGS